MPQGFAEWKALLRYFFVVSFISLAFVIVKLKFSKVFCITSESMKGLPFSGGVGWVWTSTLTNIVQPCWNFDQR